MPYVAVKFPLVFLTLNIVFAFGTNQHLICKTVEDIFNEDSTHGHVSTTPRALHGPPGKRGQRGFKGEPGIPGLKGLPGLVDPQNVETVVEEKLRDANRKLQVRLEKFETLLTKMNSSIKGVIAQISCTDDLFYKGKCYYAIIHSTPDVDSQEARNLCAAKGGTPANILDREHEDLLVNYIRSKTIVSGDTYLLLGMSYNPSTAIMRWSNGDKVPGDVVASMLWWRGYPDSRSNYVGVAIGVSSGTIGIFNTPLNYGRHGVVCEM